MTDNEIGYKIYVWQQKGYNFYYPPYDPGKDYTEYLHYFSDPRENERLRAKIIDGSLDGP